MGNSAQTEKVGTLRVDLTYLPLAPSPMMLSYKGVALKEQLSVQHSIKLLVMYVQYKVCCQKGPFFCFF